MSLKHQWDKHAEDGHEHLTTSGAFSDVLEALLTVAGPRHWETCVDLGAGTGLVTLAVAPLVASVLAVNVSSQMAGALVERAHSIGLANVMVKVADLASFDLPPASADLVISSYALHHLPDAGKRDLVARAANWLRPGGRLAVADMMDCRGQSRRQWRRIAGSVTRYGLGGGGERPASPGFWQRALLDAGLTRVGFRQILSEAGVAHGTRPRDGLRFTGPLTRQLRSGNAGVTGALYAA